MSINLKTFDLSLKFLLIGAAVLGMGASFAANFDVTRHDDPVPDGCNASDCSLREAISAANSNAEADTIELDGAGAGIFFLEQPAVDDHNFGGDLDVRGFGSTITVNGAPGGSTVSASGAERVFHLVSGSELVLADVEITGKNSNSPGAVYVEPLATLTMQRSSIRGNRTGSWDGVGGLFNGGTAYLVNSSVDSNTAADRGGIYNAGYLKLEQSTVSNNTADGSIGAGWGGGIFNSGTLDVLNSTVSGNYAEDAGGAVFNDGYLYLKNATFAGNRVGPIGASSTIFQPSWGGLSELQNTLADFGDCSGLGLYTSWGNNFGFGTAGECGSGASDIPGFPVLAPLADNGGLTRTHALLENSPAIDAAADLSGEFTTDQRGVARPQRAAWDIGAYEREPLATSVIVVNTTTHGNDLVQGDGICEMTTGAGDCSLAAAVQEATAAGIEYVSLPAGTYSQAAGFHVDAPLTITGAGSGLTIIDGQNVVSKFFVLTPGADFNLSGVTVRNSDAGALQIGAGIAVNLYDVTITGSNSSSGNAISNAGTLSMHNCLLDGNGSNVNSNYGAINNAAGAQLDLTDSEISNSIGSGLINAGTAHLLRVTLTGNINTWGFPDGGGVSNNGTVTVTDSTVNLNQAKSSGGGIYSSGVTNIIRTTVQSNTAGGISATANATIVDSRILDNTATIGATAITGRDLDISGTVFAGNAEVSPSQVPVIRLNGGVNNISATTISDNISFYGAIFVNQNTTLNLSNSTISGNTGLLSGAVVSNGDSHLNNVTIADNLGNGALHSGDGVGSISMGNSILYNNTRLGSLTNCNVVYPITSTGYNISSDASCSLAGTADLNSTDPLLMPLAGNGGLTQTYALAAGSPAIDGGDPASGCEPNDQRGISRPLDGDGDLTAYCDSGAFEADAMANPVADAGQDQSAEPVIETIVLGGIPAAAGGNPPYSYLWTVAPGVEGVDYTLSSSTVANPEFTGLVAQSYSATLTATDSKSEQDSDSAVITVEIPVIPPVADAGPDASIITGTETMVLGGSPSAANGTPPYTYTWNISGGIEDADYTLGSASEANPDFRGLTAGVYTAELTVADDNSQQHTDSATITVTIPEDRQIQGLLTETLLLEACQSIVVQQGAIVAAGASIELLAPSVSFEPGISVELNGVIQVVIGTPVACME